MIRTRVKMVEFVLGSLFVALFAAGLVSGQSSGTTKEKWQLTAIGGKAISTRAFIEIDESGERVSGHTGCNRFFGSFKINGEKVTTGKIGATKMACLSEELNYIESAFISNLNNVDGIRKGIAKLELLSNDIVVLEFKIDEGSMKLDGVKWTLESIGGKTIELATAKPFASFDPVKGSVGGNTGCNVFGGALAVAGKSLNASQMFSTMRACEEDGRMTVERQFLDALDKADRYEIKNAKLVLFAKDVVVLTFIPETK